MTTRQLCTGSLCARSSILVCGGHFRVSSNTLGAYFVIYVSSNTRGGIACCLSGACISARLGHMAHQHERGPWQDMGEGVCVSHNAPAWRLAFRQAGDGTRNPDMEAIRSLRRLIWMQTERVIKYAENGFPLAGTLRLPEHPSTTSCWRLGRRHARASL